LKILVIGHLSIDVFHEAEGQPKESFGGLVGVLKLLSSLAEKGDRIIPVCGVHADDRDRFFDLLRSLPAVEDGCVFSQPGSTHRVHYFARDGGYSNACTKDVAPPIPFSAIRDALNVDGILINMFSGSDIALETLDNIRMAIRPRGTPIHLDYHNLTLASTQDGERIRRYVPEWRRWAFMVDTVQFNEQEIAGLTPERMPEKQTVGHLLTLGVKGVLVTRAERGATLYWSEKKQVQRKDSVPPEPPKAGESVGSGDLFGAAFHNHYLRHHDLNAALDAAREMATAAVLSAPQVLQGLS
jgi:sugar/nucleoside kinase (ribokinase family)